MRRNKDQQVERTKSKENRKEVKGKEEGRNKKNEG